MAQISLLGICKNFKVHERPEGKWGLLKGAFIRNTRTVDALKSISFDIDEGELVGYIGPNGAGKSTSVKIMSGILTPDSGSCIINNRVPWKERVAHVSQIGVVFGQRSQLWWDVPVGDSFTLLKDIYAIPTDKYMTRLNSLVESLDIGGLLKTPVRQLSLGQRMRCELAAALLHSPKILFLDEPTIGLDAVSKLALRKFLKEENTKHGVTMLLTTHDMDDIEALCNRVMVIGHGEKLFDGKLQELKNRYASLSCLRISFDDCTPDYQTLMSIENVQKVNADGDYGIELFFDSSKTATHKLISVIASRFPVKDIVIREQDIDEIIASMYHDMAL